MEEKGGEEMKTENILETIEDWAFYISWIILLVLILLIFKNSSIGIEYKMIWFLLAFLGFTISRNHMKKK